MAELHFPQEVEVYHIIPALRRELAITMKELGLSQRKIAELLHLTEAAVSQYFSKKRGSDIDFDAKIKTEIKKSAKSITDDQHVVGEIQRLLEIIRNTKAICDIHKKYATLPSKCDYCEFK